MVLCYAPEFFSEAELRKSAGSHGPGIRDAQIIIGYSKPLDRPKPIFWSWRKLLFKNKIGKQGVSKQKPSDTYIRLWYQYQLTGKKIIVSRDRADIIWIKKKNREADNLFRAASDCWLGHESRIWPCSSFLVGNVSLMWY